MRVTFVNGLPRDGRSDRPNKWVPFFQQALCLESGWLSIECDSEGQRNSLLASADYYRAIRAPELVFARRDLTVFLTNTGAL